MRFWKSWLIQMRVPSQGNIFCTDECKSVTRSCAHSVIRVTKLKSLSVAEIEEGLEYLIAACYGVGFFLRDYQQGDEPRVDNILNFFMHLWCCGGTDKTVIDGICIKKDLRYLTVVLNLSIGAGIFAGDVK
jgi:hypothetical protein